MRHQLGRYVLLTCIFFCYTIFSFGQIRIGVKGGLSIPNLKSGDENPVSKDYVSRLGADFAVFGEFAISKFLSIQPQIEFSGQGGKKDGKQVFPNEYTPPPPNYLYANYKSVAKINYLLIPVLVKTRFNLGKSFQIYAGAGPFISFVLSAKNKTSGSSYIYADEQETQPITPSPQSFDSETDIKDELRKANVGIEAAAGFAYGIGKGEIFIEGGGNYGFVKIQKDKANGQNNTGAGTVTIGYAIKISK
jgi:Outer membrane protein beta-barrel domain